MEDNVKHTVIKVVSDYVLKHFGSERIECLIMYGSACSDGGQKPHDYDFQLLLDTYRPEDMCVGNDIGYPVDLFVDYKDHILAKGFDSYQRGRHGTYFFHILSYGECVMGKNFYEENRNRIQNITVKRDLLFRIEEYFYRIEKHFRNDDEQDFELCEKYISRIVLDLLLFSGDMHFEKVNTIHYKDILNSYLHRSELFSNSCKHTIMIFQEKQDMSDVPQIVKELYESYLRCFAIMKKHETTLL